MLFLVFAGAPGRPVIDIETRQRVYYEGDRFAAVCRAKVGVLAGSLIWSQKMTSALRDNKFYRFTLDDQYLVNRLELPALNRGDHNSKLTCIASNEMTREGLKASIEVAVYCECCAIPALVIHFARAMNYWLPRDSSDVALEALRWCRCYFSYVWIIEEAIDIPSPLCSYRFYSNLTSFSLSLSLSSLEAAIHFFCRFSSSSSTPSFVLLLSLESRLHLVRFEFEVLRHMSSSRSLNGRTWRFFALKEEENRGGGGLCLAWWIVVQVAGTHERFFSFFFLFCCCFAKGRHELCLLCFGNGEGRGGRQLCFVRWEGCSPNRVLRLRSLDGTRINVCRDESRKWNRFRKFQIAARQSGRLGGRVHLCVTERLLMFHVISIQSSIVLYCIMYWLCFTKWCSVRICERYISCATTRTVYLLLRLFVQLEKVRYFNSENETINLHIYGNFSLGTGSLRIAIDISIRRSEKLNVFFEISTVIFHCVLYFHFWFD